MAEEFQNATPQGGEGTPAPAQNAGSEPVQELKGGEQSNNTNAAPSQSSEDLQKELLGQLGVNSLEDAKAALEAYKEYQESQKTEAQKQAEQLQALQDQLSSSQAEKQTLSAKVEALAKGVRADAVEDVIKLVQGAEDVGKAIESILTKYPHFGQAQEAPQSPSKPTFGQPQYKEPAQSTDLDKWQQAMKKFTGRY